MKKTFDKYVIHTNSYIALRNAVGWIGMLLPFTLMLGVFLIFKEEIIHESISHYYHTGMRNVFVGALCAVALFLFFYSGYDKTDDWIGNFAGFFAVGVAWFPATESGSSDLIGKIHFICAAALFITLAVFSLFRFTKTHIDKVPTRQKRLRNRIYITCGLIMFLGLISIVIYLNFFKIDNSRLPFVFWAETIVLLAFGVSWLTKGETFFPDK